MERPWVMVGARSRGQLVASVSGVLVIAGLAISLAAGTASSQPGPCGYDACPTQTLTVSKNGTGTGTVTSSPAGINCGATCSHDFADATLVTLTPTADAGSQFAGWSGACAGAGGCTVTMSAAKSVTATFNTVPQHTLTVTRNGTGTGTVTSSPAGINCGATCSHSYNENTMVTLTPTADVGSQFASWSGDCTGTGGCTVTMSAAKFVTATFNTAPPPHDLTVFKNGTGSGNVSSSPAGIDCGATCTHSYAHGSSVTLTATAASGSDFSGWSGAGCSGNGTCVVTMDAAKSVTATFTLQTHALTVSKSGNGSGSVSSSPAGIDCGGTCSASYDHGTSVTLTATAAAGSTFTGWSGSGCSGAGTCTVTMDADEAVTATFTLQPPPTATAFTLQPPPTATPTEAPTPAGTPVLTPTGTAPRPAARGISLRVKPNRDRSRPYRFKLSGRVRRPRSVPPSDACQGRVTLEIRRSGKLLKRMHTRLRQTCNFSKTVLLGPRITPGRHGKVLARAAFDGNPAVGPFTGTAIPLHYGPKR